MFILGSSVKYFRKGYFNVENMWAFICYSNKIEFRDPMVGDIYRALIREVTLLPRYSRNSKLNSDYESPNLNFGQWAEI